MDSSHSLFDLLVLSLGNAALIALGQIENPENGLKEIDLTAAQSNIEMLEMLRAKTRGNLTQSEEQLISQLIYDLQLKFVDGKK